MDAETDAVDAPLAAEGDDGVPVAEPVLVPVEVPAAVAEEDSERESDGGDNGDCDGAAPYEIGAIQEEEEEPTDDHEAPSEPQHVDGTANGAGGDGTADGTAGGSGQAAPLAAQSTGSDGTADGNGQVVALGMAAAPSNMRPLVTRSGGVSDWVECATADGDTFYYHLASGETSWAPPFELLPPLASDRHGSHGDSLVSATARVHSFHRDGDADGGEGDASTASGSASGTASVSASHHLVKRALDGALRRLDPHTQLQLEEARRRHYELEELRDEEVRMGGEHWVEMYDPTHDGFYYYGVQSGELRWDRPDSYVMRVESDDVLRMVVRLQCVFRMKLARRKVFLLKLQRGLIPSSGVGATGDSLNPWVEVYDPFHKVLYYYCASTGETRWDPPAHFISAAEDREMAAAIAIQSMSRSHLARREVKKRKTTIRKKQHEQAVGEARRLREVRRKEFSAKTDGERESMCRREMLEEEMEQIKEGDLFWGVDRHDQEVVRQRMEEKLLADAEAFWQRVNMTLRLRVEMEMQRSQEEEAQRRELELIAQVHESDRMRAAEADQCRLGDAFWGIQAEEQREAQARADMDVEQNRSRLYGEQVSVEDQRRVWAEERERRLEEAKVAKVVNEKRHQRQYFQWFYSKCETADDVLDYLWPTHQRFTLEEALDENSEDPALDNQGSPATKDAPAAPQTDATPRMPKPPPYVLDDAVLRARLETDYRYGNKSIFTIHDPNSARVLGRRGQYVLSHVDTDAVYAAAAKKADAKPRPTSPTRPMPASSKPIPNDTEEDEEERIRFGMFPALHYRHAHAPDPHLPARYNGVPFHPSDLNPTRDILLSNHTKLTQLPSLAWSPHRESFPKKPLVVLKKANKSPFPSPHAKAAKEPKRRQSSLLLAMQASNNNTVDPLSSSLGFASPFYREAQAERQRSLQHAAAQQKKETPDERKAREALEKAQRVRRKYAARFEAEELGAVQAVFVAMDLDGSGTINKSEMVWALQRDGEVHALARQSALLRLLLKQQSHLEELFVHLRMSDTQREEISWDVFRVFCEELYISLMQQGILDSYDAMVNGGSPTKEATNATQKAAPLRQQGAAISPLRGRQTRKGSIYLENKEEQLIRRVFGLCDQDGNGVLEIDELQRALYADSDPALQRLIRSSKALQPLLHQNTFVDAFCKFEPLDPRGISEEEFVVFCLEIADIAMLNGML